MPKFSVDYKVLENNIYKKSIKLSEVKDKIEKVAFDVVRFKDSDLEQLWQIQSSDDGEEYIVALYKTDDDDSVKKTASKQSNWEVVYSDVSNHINIFYKNEQIAKIASHKLGLPKEELFLVKRYLPKKLAENKELVRALLSEVSESTRKYILNKYPELS